MISGDRVWLKAWAVLLFIFFLGGLTGASIDGIYRARAGSNSQTTNRMDSAEYLESLKQELNLNTEQASAMRGILDEMRSEYKAICSETRPKYEVLRENARLRMRALLSQDQQKHFDSMATKDDCLSCPLK